MNTVTLTHFLNGFLMVAVPLILAVLLTRLWKSGWRIWWIGCATFVISQVGHIPFNILVSPLLQESGLTSLSPSLQRLVNSLFLGLSAGIFEEGARYLILRFWAKDDRSWRKGVLFGAGHGGAEAIILGGLVLFGFIQMLILHNASSEELQRLVGASNLATAQAQIQSYWSLPWQQTLLGAVERTFTLPIQIGMAVLVMQAFTRKNILWLFAAIGFHALIDGIAVFFQPIVDVYALEGVVALFAAASLVIIILLQQPEPAEKEVKSPEAESPISIIKSVKETPENLEKSRYQS
jgi:uncharacterized membrane protein YhfC